jgi:histidyl-tRNA synthetase
MNTISNLPVKGTSDWYPSEYLVRKYIFDTWRKVCLSFGYEEYLTPIVEEASMYRAKSGEDVGGKELMAFTDRGGRELSIRPEMTPSVTRMVSRIYGGVPKPIRLFSIANYFRNEKPQRGRNREFWQLNYDIFGSSSLEADIEILTISLEIMMAFKATKGSFTMFVNNRKLIEGVLSSITVNVEEKTQLLRTLDKFEKLSEEDFRKMLQDLKIESGKIDRLVSFMKCENASDLTKIFPDITNNEGYKQTLEIIDRLSKYSEYVKFKPSVIRGFDYYDGMIFEVFDNNPLNSRTMFGGGRYNGLAGIFGGTSFEAVGCAPGDETTKLFLEVNNLLPDNLKPEVYYLPLLTDDKKYYQELASKLRSERKNVVMGYELQNVSKALAYANSRSYTYVVIAGEEEIKQGKVKVKNMKSGEEKSL